MAPSYRRINYRLRPAKSVERKMIMEALVRLDHRFGELSKYRYVGFGSTYFVDFSLFHKVLGIENMISIEDAQSPHDQRFEFNKPFDCIKLKFGNSSSVLPRLNWNIRSIVWLDYDGAMTSSVLGDVQTVAGHCPAGSILLVTVQADAPGGANEASKRVEMVTQALGAHRIPSGLTNDALSGWKTAALYHRVLTNEIREALATRNGASSEGSQMHFRQLFRFHYSDGAKMLTVGGVFYDAGQDAVLDGTGISKLHFVRGEGMGPMHLVVPMLTPKEVRSLDERLPTVSAEDLADVIPLPASDIRDYSVVYRYYPSFSEIEP